MRVPILGEGAPGAGQKAVPAEHHHQGRDLGQHPGAQPEMGTEPLKVNPYQQAAEDHHQDHGRIDDHPQQLEFHDLKRLVQL